MKFLVNFAKKSARQRPSKQLRIEKKGLYLPKEHGESNTYYFTTSFLTTWFGRGEGCEALNNVSGSTNQFSIGDPMTEVTLKYL